MQDQLSHTDSPMIVQSSSFIVIITTNEVLDKHFNNGTSVH